jgi:hypothetical protein
MRLELLTNATVVDDAFRFVGADAKKIEQYKDTKIDEDGRNMKADDTCEAERIKENSNDSYNTTV